MTATRRRPLIGRQAEAAALQAAWRAAWAGEPRIVVVAGDAGVGKSRLARHARDLMGPVARELVAQCSPQHTGTAFQPLASALTEAWGLRAASGPEAAAERVRTEIGRIADPPAGSVSLLLGLLGLPPAPQDAAPVLAPGTARRRTMDVVIGWLRASAAKAPLLVLIEDLHWADASTLAFTAALVDELDAGQLLVVVTARPPVAVPPAQTARVIPLTLVPLDPDETSALVDAIAGATPLGAVVRGEIIERTDGVPLFVEELTRVLIDPVTEGAAPPWNATLRDLLTTRLDRLVGARAVAQAAATIGTDFSLPILEAVSPVRGDGLRMALDRLVAADLLERLPSGDHRFRHALIRDAAYDTQTVEEARATHARVADTVVRAFPELAQVQPEVVAYHLDEAGREAESAPYWCRAAVRERQRGSYAEAIELLRRAESSLAAIPASAERDRLELEILVTLGISQTALKGFAAPEVGVIHQRARDLCQRVEAGPLLFAALGGLWQFYYSRNDFATAHALAEQHRDAVRRAHELNRLCASYTALGYTSYHTGALAKAREQLEIAIGLYESYPRPAGTDLNPIDPGISAATCLVSILCLVGELDRAMRQLQETIARAEQLDPRAGGLTLAYAHIGAARAFIYRREPDRAVEHAQRGVAIARELGYSGAAAMGTLDLGAALAARGDTTAALAILEPGIPRWRAAGFEMYRPFLLGALAQARAQKGDRDGALRHVDGALADAEAFGERVYEPELHRQRGELLHTKGQDDAAAAAFTRAIETAGAQGSRLFALRAAASLHRLRRSAESRALLAAHRASFTEGLDSPDLRETREA